MTAPPLPVGAVLADVVGDCRVVLLGDVTHGDGAAYEAMTDIVVELHRDHGFSTLIFESPMVDMGRAWDAFSAGKAPNEAARMGVFSIWSAASETQNLWKYVARNAVTSSPLAVTGCDWQILRTGWLWLLERLGVVVEDATVEDLWDGRLGVEAEKTLVALKQAARHDDELRRIVDGLDGMARSLAASARDPRDLAAYCARDIWMGREVVRQVKANPDGRFIVWSASFHCARVSNVIGESADGVAYSELEQMGDVVHQELRGQARVISVIAGGGEWGHYGWPEARTIADSDQASFEARCLKAFDSVALVRPPEEMSAAAPFGYTPATAKWTEVLDAFLFVPTMRRATPATAAGKPL